MAEEGWRFYDPEKYYRFEKLREKRNEMLTVQRSREETIMRISAEAEASMDEYLGVMIDFGLADKGETLFTADPEVSAISGVGREYGLDGEGERRVLLSIASLYVLIIISPVGCTLVTT